MCPQVSKSFEVFLVIHQGAVGRYLVTFVVAPKMIQKYCNQSRIINQHFGIIKTPITPFINTLKTQKTTTNEIAVFWALLNHMFKLYFCSSKLPYRKPIQKQPINNSILHPKPPIRIFCSPEFPRFSMGNPETRHKPTTFYEQMPTWKPMFTGRSLGNKSESKQTTTSHENI